MAVTAARTSSGVSADDAGTSEAVKCGTVIRLEGRLRRVTELTTWDHHNVERVTELVAAKQVSNTALCPVAPNGIAQFPGSGNPQPRRLKAVRQHEQRHEPPSKPGAPFVDLLKLGAPGYSLALRKPVGCRRHQVKSGVAWGHSSARPALARRDRQAFAPLGAPAFDDQAPVLGRHPHQESMSAFAPSVVGLKRTFHRKSFVC